MDGLKILGVLLDGLTTIRPGPTRYRLLGPDGTLLAESSDPAEIARFAAESGPGCTTEQLRTFTVTAPWEPWTPAQEQQT